MNIKKRSYVCFILVVGIFASCSSNDSTSAPATPSVYVAGSYSNGGNRTATVWKDGVANDRDCPVGTSGSASSVYVSGGHIYVAGNYIDGVNSFAAVWIDGAMTDISISPTYNYATSIFVSGGSVYVAGSYNEGVNDIAVIWTDAGAGFVATDLANPGTSSTATSVFVVAP